MLHYFRICFNTIVRLALLISVSTFLLSSGQVQAATPQPNAEKFVQALVEAGYPDIAIFYMEKIKADKSIPPALDDIYDMQMGSLHMANSGIQSSQDDQLKEIDLAHESFAKFIKEKPNHARIRECARNYASLMMARGTLYRELATKSRNKKKEQIDEWLKISRDSFNSSQKEFLANRDRAKDVLKKFKAEKKESGEEFEDAVNDYLQAWLAVCGCYYELAQTYEPGSKEYNDNLELSRKEYNAIFKKYGTIEPPYKAGLFARLREGRIMMDQGKFDDPDKINKGALSIFAETLTLDNNNDFRMLREEALLYYIQSSLKYKNEKEPAKQNKLFDDALIRFSEWYDKDYTGSRLSERIVQQLLLAGCEAAAAKISALPEAEKKIRANALLAKNTLEILNLLAKTDFKDEARAVKAKLGVVAQVENIPPEQMAFPDLMKELNQVREMIADIQSAAEDAKTDEQKAEIEKRMLTAADKYLKLYTLAEFRRPNNINGIQLRQMNSNRYLAVYMMFLKKDVYRAIMLADFVVKNYATDPSSETTASLEMKILRSRFSEQVQTLRKAGKTDEEILTAVRFELTKMVGLAKVIQVRTKEKGPDMADDAWSSICDSFVDVGDIKYAIKALNQISENSDQRANCEIRTGNLLWNNYLRGMRADLSVRPSQAKLDEYKTSSQKILQEGVDRMKKSMAEGQEPTSNLIFATYTLANLKLNSGDAQGALALLNDKQFGPLTMVKKDSELVKRNELDLKTLRTALRALVAAQQLDDAKGVMDLLEKRVEQSVAQANESEAVEDGKEQPEVKTKEEQLTTIYIALGLELKENLEVFNREGKKEEAEKLEKGFEIFLERIGGQDDAKFGSMYWVAQTYQSLGENATSISAAGEPISEKAKGFFGKAVAMYEKIIANIQDKSKADFVKDPKRTLQVINNCLALCFVASQEYEKAIAVMGDILKKTPNNIDLQAEAARCYMSWGDSTADKTKSAEYYRKAVSGCGKDFLTVDQKDPKQNNQPAIWGWAKLGTKMQNQLIKKHSTDPRVSETFFEARYILPSIYIKQAEDIQDKKKKLERLQQAEKLLVATHKAFPILKDEETFDKYDKQLKQVRSLMKPLNPEVKVEGFSELETAMGFADKGQYQEAIDRVLKVLLDSKTRKSAIEEMQPFLASYYAKLATKTLESDPTQAMKYFEIALDGDPTKVNERGEQVFIGFNGILKSVTNDKGEPIRNPDPDKDKLTTYLQTRLSIAEVLYTKAMYYKDVANAKAKKAAEKTEQDAEEAVNDESDDEAGDDAKVDANNEADTEDADTEEAPAEDAKAEKSEKAEDVKAEESTPSQTTSAVMSRTTADDAPADATDTDTEEAPTEAKSEKTEEVPAEDANTEDAPAEEAKADEAEAPSDDNADDNANGSDVELPQQSKELLIQVKTMIWDDYNKYKKVENDTEVLGNSDMLQTYENMLKQVQEELGEPASGFAPPESLIPKEEVVEEKPEEPANPMIMYCVLGGVGLLGLIAAIIIFLPKKKSRVIEKQELKSTSEGIEVGSEKREETVDLGFAPQAKAEANIDLGLGGGKTGSNQAVSNIDLGFGTKPTQGTVSFNITKKSDSAAQNGKSATRTTQKSVAGQPKKAAAKPQVPPTPPKPEQ